ncbi:anaphase-promoting complex subunit 13 [Trichonephila clavipes]|uniref:Anaphase-promoting complex subunit 13 n=1 Tax=Trichonephila clavipes TaxID=2585209 RepID=A0A8X6WF33_TRICX|nr:anaphase-promoting complex subunit 13 [Trichonephila clavipes]
MAGDRGTTSSEFLDRSVSSIRMDSNVARNGRLIDLVDTEWRQEKLPNDSIAVPAADLPDAEPDNSNPQETLREQEQKWTDLALNRIDKNVPRAHSS